MKPLESLGGGRTLQCRYKCGLESELVVNAFPLLNYRR